MAKAQPMSALVKKHFALKQVNESYLFNTPFTNADLKRIIAGEGKELISWEVVGVRKQRDVAMTYEDYLKKAGLSKKLNSYS